MIDQTFRNINRLFGFSSKNGDNDLTRDSFDNYYMPSVKIKYFNALINNKPFFDQPTKKTNKTLMKDLLKCEETKIM